VRGQQEPGPALNQLLDYHSHQRKLLADGAKSHQFAEKKPSAGIEIPSKGKVDSFGGTSMADGGTSGTIRGVKSTINGKIRTISGLTVS
jgi:hypothetical protein